MPSEIIHAETQLQKTEPTTMDIIQQVIGSGGNAKEMAEVVRELVALRQSEERFKWEREERQAKIDFDDALNACQSQIGRIAPDGKRENGITWATYAQLDRVIRPIYTTAGFALAFSEVEHPNRLRMRGTLSRGGISKDFYAEISTVPVNSKMNDLDANASAASRVKRYLLLDIFNIAVGIDADEKKPYIELEYLPETTVSEYVDALNNAPDLDSLKSLFAECWAKAKNLNDSTAKQSFQKAYEAQKKRFAQ